MNTPRNYKMAVQQLFKKAPKRNGLLSQLPNGWIYLQRNGMVYDTWSETKRNEHKLYLENQEKERQLNTMANRFLTYKREELELEGYTTYEIENMIDEMFLFDDDYEGESTTDYESDDSDDSF